MDQRLLSAKYLRMAESIPNSYRAFFDGCCEPRNPGGTAGYGAFIVRGRERVWEHSGFVPPAPTTSNNIAEYLAINEVLDWFLQNEPKTPGFIFGDSQLVICQLWGWPTHGRRWKIHGVDTGKRKGFYADAAVAARRKVARLPKLKGFWIPREINSEADDLSKSHLRARGVEFRIQPESAEVG